MPLRHRDRTGGEVIAAAVDGTTRLLRNVTGLWVLTECLRAWPVSWEDAHSAADDAPAFGP